MQTASVGSLNSTFQWRGNEGRGLPGFTPEEALGVQQDAADAVVQLLRLADMCHFDLAAAACAHSPQTPPPPPPYAPTPSPPHKIPTSPHPTPDIYKAVGTVGRQGDGLNTVPTAALPPKTVGEYLSRFDRPCHRRLHTHCPQFRPTVRKGHCGPCPVFNQ